MLTIVLFYLYYLSSTIQNVTDEAEIDKFGYEHVKKAHVSEQIVLFI